MRPRKKKALTKAGIVNAVQTKVGFSKQATAKVVDDLFEIIKESLERGEDVTISGFGAFQVRGKKARRGRNPRTGEEITISARRVVSFKPSQLLRKALNKTP